MGCEPCKNFKCKYEHMKLIEKVRELENEHAVRCDNCIVNIERNALLAEVSNLKQIRDKLVKENRNVITSHMIMNDRIKTFKFALYAESLMLLISSIVILKLALGW